MKLLKNRFSKRATAIVMMSAMLVLGTAATASAASYCRNEPFPGDVGVDVGPGIAFVGADTNSNGNGGYFVCVQGPLLDDSVGVYVQGATLSVVYCYPGTSCTTELNKTGADAGTLVACNPTTGGTCLDGTTIWANGTPQGLDGRTGVDDNVTFPTITWGPNITCVSNVCARSFKISAGSVAVYADSDTPQTVYLCMSGPFMSCP